VAQHQPQPGAAGRNRWWADRHREQTGRLQLLLQGQSRPVVPQQQRQDRPLTRRPRPAIGPQGQAPAEGAGQQLLAPLRGPGPVKQGQGREGPGGQGWRQGSGVAKGAARLQQPVAQQPVGGHEGPATAEGLAEGAAHQGHPFDPMGQAAAVGAQQAEGVGLVDQQRGPVVMTERGHGGHRRRGALHAVEAFAEHQKPLAWAVSPGDGEASVQVAQVIVAETLQPGTAGPHAHQQRVVDEPVGQHEAVAVGQGADGGQVRLEAAGEHQHGLPSQPDGQGLLEQLVHGPAAAHQS